MPARRSIICTLVGALVVAAGCHQGTPALTPSNVATYSRARLADFSFDVPLPSDSGVCVSRAAPSGAGTALSLYYPDRTNAVTGATVNQFVVDSTGAIRPSTFKVLRATDMGLIEEAKRVLTQWRYLPAEIDGRKVAQLVQTAIER